MIEAKRRYVTVAGNFKPGWATADMHVHTVGDTATTPERTVRQAIRRGLSAIFITDHDRVRSVLRCREEAKKQGSAIEIFPGVESTAVVDGRRKSRMRPRHVLAFNVKEAPPCYMPVGELNQMVHEQGGFTSAAHPGLGRFSITHREILEIQDKSEPDAHFDFAEVHNGGVSLLTRFAAGHPLATRILAGTGLMPKPMDYNGETKDFLGLQRDSLHLKGVTAGSDDHDGRHIGEVVVGYDPEIGVFKSIQEGSIAILQEKWMASINYLSQVPLTIRGLRLEYERRRGKNGIVVYQPEVRLVG